MNGDDKGAGGREDDSNGEVMDKNNGVRGGKVGKGVGNGEICSENIDVIADSGTISVVTSKNSEDCVASSCDTEKVTSEGRGEAFSSKMSLLVIVTFISLRLV